MEDVLGGFEDEDETFTPDLSNLDSGEPDRFWHLSGSLHVASSINYLDHKSATGTDYDGLQKLRTRLNLELDLDLPRNWKVRLGGYGFYDFAYEINGRNEYEDEVLDDYEWEVDSQEMYVQGSLTEDLDLKIGRQIVNWGRSDTVRVLDILNPLDNREPGLGDVEDLRLPVTMVRLDYYWGPWSVTAITLPELRFDKTPPFGSDFVPSVGAIPPERRPQNTFENIEWAGALRGIFPGWDVSLHIARVWDDLPHIADISDNPAAIDIHGEFSRLFLVGAGGNYAYGSWLFKGEVAFIEGRDYTTGMVIDTPIGRLPAITGTVEKSRVDVMGGIEYYGIAETNIAVEIVHRHINDFDEDMKLFDAVEDAPEATARITSEWFNDRLETTVLGVIFGEKAQDGSIVRLQADYDIRDALVATAGLLLYQHGDRIFSSEIGSNDRVFLELKYSF